MAKSYKLKICGFKNINEIENTDSTFIDYYGIVLVPNSKNIFQNDLNKACKLIKSKKKLSVGIIDIQQNNLKDLIENFNFDLFQIFGCHEIGYYKTIEKLQSIKKAKKYIYTTTFEQYKSEQQYIDNDKFFEAIAFDNKAGGSGISWDYEKSKTNGINKNLWIGGGINNKNISQVLHADVIDISSFTKTDNKINSNKINNLFYNLNDPLKNCWTQPKLIIYVVKYFFDDNELNDEKCFEFFDKFNTELNKNNDICKTILIQFRRKILDECKVKKIKTEDCLDIVGTGGNELPYNISTPCSLLISSLGYNVLKHGNTNSTSKSGSANIIYELGANIELHPDMYQNMYEKINYSFIFAKKVHLILAKFANIRKKYKNRSLFNLLGPLCNPYSPKYNILGVSSNKIGELYAEIVKEEFGDSKTMIVCGNNSIDKLLPNLNNIIWLVDSRGIQKKNFNYNFDDISEIDYNFEGTPFNNAKLFSELILNKHTDQNQYCNMILLNSAAALVLIKNIEWKVAIDKCRKAIEDKKLEIKVREFVYWSNNFGGRKSILNNILKHKLVMG